MLPIMDVASISTIFHGDSGIEIQIDVDGVAAKCVKTRLRI
jgi:hypothetical protein